MGDRLGIPDAVGILHLGTITLTCSSAPSNYPVLAYMSASTLLGAFNLRSQEHAVSLGVLEEEIPWSCRRMSCTLHKRKRHAGVLLKLACKATLFDFRAVDNFTDGFWIPWS